MKTKNIILVLIVLIFNSCIVKSLHPFYTKETITSDENFLGEWKDNKGATWNVTRLVEEMLNEKPLDSLSKEDLKDYYKFQHAFKVVRIKNKQKAVFLAMPFKINKQVFLDFTPFEIESNLSGQSLLKNHYVSVHSLVKYDVFPNGNIGFKWLDEDKIESLFEQKKIKIKHEKIGFYNHKYLLTAQPEELQKFIKKYMASSDTEKWKTSIEFTLTKTNEKSK